jgi:hypothetical protein
MPAVRPCSRPIDDTSIASALAPLSRSAARRRRQQHRVRRGVAGASNSGSPRPDQAHAQRADDGGRSRPARQRLAQPHGARGLAVGAGDADGEHAGIRLAVEGVRDRAGVLFQVGDGQVRHVDAGVPGKIARFEHDGGGALLDAPSDEAAAVAGVARIGEEHVARPTRRESETRRPPGAAARIHVQISAWVNWRSSHCSPRVDVPE